MSYLDEEGLKKVVHTGGWRMDHNEAMLALSEPQGKRPRVYAYIYQGHLAGQVIQIRSLRGYRAHGDNIQVFWSNNVKSLKDLIERVVQNGQGN